ncbi:ankyrin repeat domain-containing protein 50 [Microdochium nivale]|nr:ankyrin repeat domain-containing protein 50 [Microdochium nivale]
MSNRNHFTIGWVCALDTECIAAQMMFDEVLDKPDDIPPKDANAYTYGRISGHNIVVALLPHGQYGISSATSVVKDMIRTFPIRNMLMVGIAGGAPRHNHEPDIRLGDVVVSSPGNGNSGVLHYGYGRKLQDREDQQRFKTTSHLNQSSLALLNAMNLLKATHRTEGHQIQECMREALQAKKKLKPKTRRELQRPDPSTDKLFRPDLLHVSTYDNCDHCGDDESALVHRLQRDLDDDDPMIHYGLIGCADQLMKDAIMRDKLSQEKGILCFEMEAAGLMNQVPSIAIRGICDYADSHKNKIWQGYAAMTAAAFAKELLRNITPEQVLAEARLADRIETGFSNMSQQFENVNTVLGGLETTSHNDHIRQWLSPADPSTNDTRARRLRHHNTGRWLLETPEYNSWKDARDTFLWLHGKPGCGKTVISSTVIDDLSLAVTKTHTLLYFYFDFSDTAKQTVDSLLRSLVHQLYHQMAMTQAPLNSLYALCQDGVTQPSRESLQSTLESMLQLVGHARVVLDALDECTTRKELFEWIRHLREASLGVSLVVTSRPEQDIKASILGMKHGAGVLPLQNRLVHDDIRQFVDTRVHGDNPLRRWRHQPNIQARIQKSLLEKADGMFRWVACQLDALENCKDPKALDKALQSLPRTLDETYNRIVKGIAEDDRPYAIRILQFLAYSERPLRVEEAVDAIAVDPTKQPPFDPAYRMPEPDEISQYCSGLVIVSERSDDGEVTREMQLSHYSVKEWLESDRLEESLRIDFQQQYALAAMAEICVAYLLELPGELGITEITSRYPFAHYTANHWAEHTSISQTATASVTSWAMKLFNCAKTFDLSLKLNDWTKFETDRPGYRHATCLVFSAYHGLQEATKQLVEQGADINTQVGYYGNALYAASSRGHEAIVRLLLDRGADVNARSGRNGNALQAASLAGHEAIVRLLLDRGANVNARSGRNGNALQAASLAGHEATVRLLLDRGANVNAQGGRNGNALMALEAASLAGHEATVRLLLDRGANVNAQGGYYGNALQAASLAGHEAIVRLLLDRGANVNARSGRNGNALQAASLAGHEATVRLLLDRGANVNAQGGRNGNALMAASSRRHEAIVRLLLNRGADVNT